MFWFSLPLFALLVHFTTATSPQSSESPSKQVTLSKWQYCAGCKGAVEILTTLATNKIVEMEKSGNPSGGELDITPLVENLCDLSYYDRYDPFMRYGCLKLLQDHQQEFLSIFDGDVASVQFSVSKVNIYSKTKEICLNVAKACPTSMFTSPAPKDRTECRGCQIIVDDLETMKNVLPPHLKYGNEQVNRSLLESLCQSIGYGHQPYTWLEEICDEMVGDHLSKMTEILKIRDQLSVSNMIPKQTLSEKICGEIFSCEINSEL
jgi:hypothetical protein